jgi:hypothetical protein
MSGLTNSDGSHSKDSPESRYMKLIFKDVMRSLTMAGITGVDISDNCFEFSHEGIKVMIKVTVK